MGKRKLHDAVYYQCDWTGLPMNAPNCFMPSWNASSGKLAKHGNYCNWESVAAHAQYNFDKCLIDKETLEDITRYVNKLCGKEVYAAPFWYLLDWLNKQEAGGNHLYKSAAEFHEACCLGDQAAFGVLLHVQPVGKSGRVSLADFQGKISMVVPRKLKGDKEIVAFFHEPDYAASVWDLNEQASQLCKTQIHGPVLLVHRIKEACFMPRARHTDLSLKDFTDAFEPKQKKRQTPVSMSVSEFEKAKTEMAESFASVEHVASAQASRPEEMAQASVCPPATGKELADLVDPTGEAREAQKMKKLQARMEAAPSVQPMCA